MLLKFCHTGQTVTHLQSVPSDIWTKQAAAFSILFIHSDYLLGFTNAVLVQLLCRGEIAPPFLVIIFLLFFWSFKKIFKSNIQHKQENRYSTKEIKNVCVPTRQLEKELNDFLQTFLVRLRGLDSMRRPGTIPPRVSGDSYLYSESSSTTCF